MTIRDPTSTQIARMWLSPPFGFQARMEQHSSYYGTVARKQQNSAPRGLTEVQVVEQRRSVWQARRLPRTQVLTMVPVHTEPVMWVNGGTLQSVEKERQHPKEEVLHQESHYRESGLHHPMASSQDEEGSSSTCQEGAVRLLKLPQGSMTFSTCNQPKVAQDASKVKEVARKEKPVQAGSKPSTTRPAQKPTATPAQMPTATPAQKAATAPAQKPTATPAQKAASAPAQNAATAPVQKAATAPAQKPMATPAQKPTATLAQKPTATAAQKPTATPAQKPTATAAQKPPTTQPAQKTAAAPAQKNAASAAQKPTAAQLAQKAAAAPVQKASATPATAQTQKAPAASAQKPPPTRAQKNAATPAQKALATPAQKVAGTPAEKPTTTQTQKPLAAPAPKTATAPAQKPPATPAQKAAAAQPAQKVAVAPAQKNPATPAQKAPAATTVPKPTDTSAQKSAATQPAEKAAGGPVQKAAAAPAQKPTATPAQKAPATPAQKPPTTQPVQKTAAAPAQKATATPAQKPPTTQRAQKTAAAPAQKNIAAAAQKPTGTQSAQKAAAAPAQKASATPAQKAAGTPAETPTAIQTQKPLAAPAPKTAAAPAQKSPATLAQKAAAAQPAQETAVTPAQKTPATPAQKAPAATALPKPTATSAQKAAATQPAEKAAGGPVQKVATAQKSGNSSGMLEGVVLTLLARGFKGTIAVKTEQKTEEDTPVSMDTLEPVKSPVPVKEESTADDHSRSQSQSQSRSRSPSLSRSRSPSPSQDIGDTTNQSCSHQTPQSELQQGSSERSGGDGGGNSEAKRGRDDRESSKERTIGDSGGSSDARRGRDGRESSEERSGGDDQRSSWSRDPRKEKHGGQSSGSSSPTSSRKRQSNENVSSVTAEMASKRAKTGSSPTAKMSTKRGRTSLSNPTAKLSTKRAKTNLSGQSSPAPEVTDDDEDLVRKEVELKELTVSLNRLKAMLAMCTPPSSPGTNDINDTEVTPQHLPCNVENAVELSPSPSLDTGVCLEQQLKREAEVTEERAILLGQESDDTQQTGSEQSKWSGQDQSAAQTHGQLNKDEQFCQDKTLLQFRTAALSEEGHKGQELYDPFQVDEEDEIKSMEETTKKQPAFHTSNINTYRSPAAETKEDEEELVMKVRELERLNALIAEGKAMLAMKTVGTPPDCECPTQADKTPEISTKCQPHPFLPVPQRTHSTLDNHRTTALSEKSRGAEPYDPFEVEEEDDNTMMEGSIKGLHHESQQQEETAEGVGIGTEPYIGMVSPGIGMVSPLEGQLLSRAKGVGIGGMGIVSQREDRPFSQPEVEDEETYLYGEKPSDCYPACSKHLKSSDQCEKTEKTPSPDKSGVPKLTFGELETIFLSMGFNFPQSSTVNQLGSTADEAIKPHGTTPSFFSSHVDTHGSQVYDPFQVSEEAPGNEAVEASKREHGNPPMEEHLTLHGNQPVKAGVGERWKQAMEAITGQPEMGGYGKQLVEDFIEELENPLMETAIQQHRNKLLEDRTLGQPQEGLLGEGRNALSGYDLEFSKQEGMDLFSRAKEHNRSKEHKTGGQTISPDKEDQHHQTKKATPKVDSLQHPQGPVANSVETIWICGDGLVDLASRLANSPTYDMTLAQSIVGVRLYWKGELAMKWAGLVPLLLQLAHDWPIPDMLIIHLGDDDIIMRETQELLCAMERDLTFIHHLFPHCLIVWSDLLPNNISKQGSSALVVQDGIHDEVNRRMHAVVAALGGTALTHELLIPELYRHHGARFSRLVVEKLFLNIKQFVGQWSSEVDCASEMCSPECHPLPCASSFSCSIPDDSLVSIHSKSTNSHSKHKERPPSHRPSLTKKQQQVTEGKEKPKVVEQDTEEQQQVGEEKSREEAKHSTEDRKLPTEEAKRSTEKDKWFIEVARQSTEEPKQSTEDAKWSREAVKQSTEEARKPALAGARAVLAEKRAALEAQKVALEAKLAKFAVSPTLSHSEHTTDQQLEELKIKLKILRTIAKKVWIIGNAGVLMSVQKHICQVENGLVWKPYWIPLGGVTLSKVIQHLLDAQSEGEGWPNPDMLIIHLGSSCDIPQGNLEQMVLSIQEHLVMVRRILPQCALVWSDILSRTHRKTQGHKDACNADLASNRHKVNLRLRNIVKQLGGAAMAHGNIQPEHFVSGGRRFTIKGQQLFKQNILDFVDQWKWDHNSIPSLSEPLPEPTTPADHKETLGPSTDRANQPITGCGTQKAPRVVWICGKKFCGFARDSAEQLNIPLRSGTGLLKVVWKAVTKFKFSFRNLLRLEGKVIRQPDMVIIYLGDDEVRGNRKVVTHIKREMELLHTVFPECLIVWSDVFKGIKPTIKLTAADRDVDYVNYRMHTVVTELGGRVVSHDNISVGLFQSKYSKKVISTMQSNLNIQEFVLKWGTEVRGLAPNTKLSPQ